MATAKQTSLYTFLTSPGPGPSPKRTRLSDSASQTQTASIRRAECQQNTITVDKPSGPTTIIINSTSHSEGTASDFTTSNSSLDSSSLDTDSEPSLSSSSRFTCVMPQGDTNSANHRESLCNRSTIVPKDIAQSVNQSPVQPVIRFPSTLIGDKKRSFNLESYKSYSWLEYSVLTDSIFCYPCRFFCGSGSRADDFLTHLGYRDWKHATGKQGILEKHNNCKSHRNAMLSWRNYV